VGLVGDVGVLGGEDGSSRVGVGVVLGVWDG